jgi:ribosomal protein S18 acetylase RimI-like enzyme
VDDVEIRTFAEGDRAALRDLFARAGEGSPTETLWGHLDSEADVYLTPYLDHEPESVFLADRGGVLVGYLTGSLGGAVPGENERMDRAIREHRLMFRRGPAAFFARAVLDTATAAVLRRPTAGELHDPRWPAHLHINVLPEVRGAGVAAGLMNRWLERLAEQGSPGCHLQTLVENTRAVRFFGRMGFEPYGETPVVPGLRAGGRRVHQLTMVRPR